LRLGQSLKLHGDMHGTETDLERGIGLDLCPDLGRIGRVPGHGLRDVGQLGPGRVLYNEGALLGKVALAVLAVLPHGSGGEDGRGGDVEEDVDRGVEMGEDTCDSQRQMASSEMVSCQGA
jgi:hypothetical protein